MIEIEKPQVETIEISDDATFGKFVHEPLERGYWNDSWELHSSIFY